MKLFNIGLSALTLSLLPLAAAAQLSGDFRANYIETVKLKYPDFRVIKKMEIFPERYNASVELPIRAGSSTGSKSARALVTLHDGSTGEPLESCFTPCVLHKAPGRNVFVFPYAVGHFTVPTLIGMEPQAMREKYPYWGGEFKVKLGPNYQKAYFRGKMCDSESAKMDNTDRDAKPCFRMPPPTPPVDYSGYCKIVFDVTPKGRTTNARATECSHKVFEPASLVAIKWWTYHPKIERGMAVTRPDVKTTLRYKITDFDGNLLDENGDRVED